MWYKNIAGMFFGLVTKHACDGRTDRWTDRRTDRQNCDSQDCTSIAVSRGKKLVIFHPFTLKPRGWMCTKCGIAVGHRPVFLQLTVTGTEMAK